MPKSLCCSYQSPEHPEDHASTSIGDSCFSFVPALAMKKNLESLAFQWAAATPELPAGLGPSPSPTVCVGHKGMAVEEQEGCLELGTACRTGPAELQPSPRSVTGCASARWIPMACCSSSQRSSWALGQGLRPDQLVMQVGPALCSVWCLYSQKKGEDDFHSPPLLSEC